MHHLGGNKRTWKLTSEMNHIHWEWERWDEKKQTIRLIWLISKLTLTLKETASFLSCQKISILGHFKTVSLIVPISENSGDSVTAQLLGHLNLILSFHAFLTVKKIFLQMVSWFLLYCKWNMSKQSRCFIVISSDWVLGRKLSHCSLILSRAH